MTKITKIIVLIVALLACVCIGAQVGMDKGREQQAEQMCREQGASGFVVLNHEIRCIYE